MFNSVIAKTDSIVEPSARLQFQINDMMLWGGIVYWEYEVAKGFFDMSADFTAAYGYKSEDMFPYTIERWKQVIHPDDYQYVLSMFEKVVAGHTDIIDIVYRVKTASGEWRYFRRRGGVAEASLVDKKVIRVSGTLQDITDLKVTDQLLQRRDRLLAAVNDAANILLVATAQNFHQSIVKVLHILGMATEVDRVYVWKNELIGGELYSTQVYEWSPDAEPQQGNKLTVKLKYSEAIPTWEAILSTGKCVNNIVRCMPKAEQDQLSPQGIISILVAPIMFRDEFWGFIGFDDCQNERVWDKTETGILKSAGMLIASAIQRQVTEKALIQAKDNAEVATKAKSDFLARMSHEIRTPMNAIIGLTHLALLTPLTQQQKEYIETAQQSAHILLRLINDILDFSKIEAGRMVMEYREFSIASVISDIAATVGASIQDKNLELRIDVDIKLPHAVMGDSVRLHQVVLNLLTNAIKFTTQGTIRLNVEVVEIDILSIVVLFSVSDTGIGMTPTQVQGLFQPFVQATAATTRQFGGTGLGLVISKKIVEAMHGNISCKSEQEKGTTFEFTARFGMPLEDEIVIVDETTELQTDALLVGDCLIEQATMQHYFELLRAKVHRIGAEPAEFKKILETGRIKEVDLIVFDFKDLQQSFVPIYTMLCEQHLQPMPVCAIVEHSELEAVLDELGIKDSVRILQKPVIAEDLFNVMSMTADRKKQFRHAKKTSGIPLSSTDKSDVYIPDSIRGANILLAEDNKINQMVATELLKIEKFVVTVANNGRIAVELLQKQPFDLILMDIQMPEMDGFEATRLIRADSRFSNIPILAMTANAMSGDRELCMEAGMNDHIPKPIEPQILYRALVKWLRK